MKIKLNYHILSSLQNLYAFKLRTGLALLGIIVGTASVVALVSSSQLATQHALEQFTTLGTDLFAVNLQPEQTFSTTNNKPSLTLAQVTVVQQSSADILLAAPYTSNYMPVVSAGPSSLSAPVIGATDALFTIMKIQIAYGRAISYLDKTQYFCILGHDLAEKIYANLPNQTVASATTKGVAALMGQQIRLGDHYFTVIGIAEPWPENMFLSTNINDVAIIPLAASFTLNQYTSIQDIVFKLKTGTSSKQIQQTIEQALRQQMPNSKPFFRSAKELIVSMQEQRRTFTLLLGAIGAISLVVGGIGVMNIMLVAVMERRHEIGIRMAVGARRHDIREMFLIEATVLAIMGGAMGAIMGILTSWIIAGINHWIFHLYGVPLLIGFVVSVLVGIIAGYYPAHQASRLDPIKALRLG